MTPQEIFNKAYLGVIQQGGHARNDDMSCCYLTAEGHMCAVGHVLGKDLAASWESQHHGSLLDMTTGLDDPSELLDRSDVPEWVVTHWDLLFDLQAAHDDTFDLGAFRAHAQRVAEEHGLNVPLP